MPRALTNLLSVLFLVALLSSGCGRSGLDSGDAGPDGDGDPPVLCDTDEECDDGNLSNGVEACLDGVCSQGAPIECDDGVECTADTCDSATGSCLYLPDHERCPLNELCDLELGCVGQACGSAVDCDDGHFCNGAEYCEAAICRAGTPPTCDDGIGCTADRCDDEAGRCVVSLDHSRCDDGRFCNGVEVCDAVLGCGPGSPVDCDDGQRCTVDTCDERSRSCRFEPIDADGDGYAACGCVPAPCDCDDGDITVNPGMTEQCRDLRDNDCDGLEDCEDLADCGSDPRCHSTPCESNEDCDDGQFCNGPETCSGGRCQNGPAPDCEDRVECTVDTCDEAVDRCLNVPDHSRCDDGYICDAVAGCVSTPCTDDGDCDDGQFCNGYERCSASGLCVSGDAVSCDDRIDCTADSCDEVLDRCVYRPDHAVCDNGLFCDGAEQCDAATGGCVFGDAPCGEPGPCEEIFCDEWTMSCVSSSVDDDDDGFSPTECGGRDCDDGNPLVNPRASEVCADEMDNDCNGQQDCADAACASHPSCCVPTGPEICDDGEDNDCDRLLDCRDPDCTSDPACCVPTGPEVCDDEEDNDCDGLTDCSDEEDCSDHPDCSGCVPEICWDGVDNDCDRLADCGDSDCNWYPPCAVPDEETNCENGRDDDLDGLTDCDDPDCADFPLCPLPDSCTSAIDTGGATTIFGTTAPLRDDYMPDHSAPGCHGGAGPEAVYYFRLDEPSFVHIDTMGSDFDTVLYVRSGHCVSGAQVACDDDTDGLQSEVEFVAEAGYYFVFVDGYYAEEVGDYRLHITFSTISPEVCDNGLDDDGDGQTDCDDAEDCALHPYCAIAPERGVAGCTDSRDNDGDGLFDCDDTEDCAVVGFGECCDGEDENFNGITDEFACACDVDTLCDEGVCYWETVGACGPLCTELGGDAFCQAVFSGTVCSEATGTCI